MTSDPAFVETCQRWLMFHYHCKDCYQAEDRCEYGSTCAGGKSLFQHVAGCSRGDCTHPRCGLIKDILNHHDSCKDQGCNVCAPVRSYHQTRSKPPTSSPATSSGMAAPPLPLPPPPPPVGDGAGNPDEVPSTPLTEMLMQLQPGESSHPLQPSPPEGSDVMDTAQQQQQRQQLLQQQQSSAAAGMERSHSLPMLPALPAQMQSQMQAPVAFATPNGQQAPSQQQLQQLLQLQQQQQNQQGRKMGGLFEARQREHKRQATDVGQGANFSAGGLQQLLQQQQLNALAAARASAPTSSASGAGSGGGGMPSSVPAAMSHSLSASLGVTGPGELQAMYLQELQQGGGGGHNGSGAAAPAVSPSGPPGTHALQLQQLQQQHQQQQQQLQQQQQQQQQQLQQQQAAAGENSFQRSSMPSIPYTGQAPQQSQPGGPQQQQQQQQQQPQQQAGGGVLVYSNGVVAHAVPSQPLMVSGLGASHPHISHHGPSPLGSGAALGNNGLHAAHHLAALPGGGAATASSGANDAAPGSLLAASLPFGLGQTGMQGAAGGPGGPGALNGFALAANGAPPPPPGAGPQYVALPYGGYAQLASHGGVTYTIVHHPHPHGAMGPGFATVGSAPGAGGPPGGAQSYLMSLGAPGGPGGQQAGWSMLQHPTAGTLLQTHPMPMHAAGATGPHGLSAGNPATMHYGAPGLGPALFGGAGSVAGAAVAAAAMGQPATHLHPSQLQQLAAMQLGGGLLAPGAAGQLHLTAQMAAGAT
ncbi:hypothetical protein CHLRE_03g212641v5 [Chlamydomonas reinhardtii]|uniref:TAZ-type domain-containing protein n=1 Tax=Chlamydomonas reinhardtii TaxID=3055 RepID=A0A2K3DZX6_CHLRE|nr:uncharacterized protein CHLRE_03g212641v5 [Chlamydomonas reinhardtii]PNW86085.1 hypothetical protein CHLRE_03g212641v5 [Chlamydomonas reinhardtii]